MYLCNEAAQRCVTLTQRDAPLEMRPRERSARQQWRFSRDGTVCSAAEPDQCLDVYDDPARADAHVYAWQRAEREPNQQWTARALDDDRSVSEQLEAEQAAPPPPPPFRLVSRRYPRTGYLDVVDARAPRVGLWSRSRAQPANQTWTAEPARVLASPSPSLTPSGWRLPLNASADALKRAFVADQHSAAALALNRKVRRLPGAVRFATYNVHYLTDPFERENYDGIMRTIATLDADVLALQEVSLRRVSAQRLDEDLAGAGYSETRVFCEADRVYDAPFGNMLLSRLPLADNAPPPQSITLVRNGAPEGRCAVRSVLSMPDGGSVAVYSVHLDVFDATEQTRVAQMRALLRDAESYPSALIMGDLNALRRADYSDDAWAALRERDQARGQPTHTLVTDLLERARWQPSHAILAGAAAAAPQSTVWSARAVDFIYVSPLGAHVWHDAQSDHTPVLLDVADTASYA